MTTALTPSQAQQVAAIASEEGKVTVYNVEREVVVNTPDNNYTVGARGKTVKQERAE